MPAKQKKSSTKKSPAVKKKSLPAKKTVAKKVAPKKTVAEPIVKAAVQPQVKEVKPEVKPAPSKRVYEISASFHALIVLMVVILYAEIVLLSVLYFKYDVRIESKSLVAMHQQNIVKPTLKRVVPY